MSTQPWKEKLMTLLVIAASAGGTLAVFGSVPVIARITASQQSTPPQYMRQVNPAESHPANWL